MASLYRFLRILYSAPDVEYPGTHGGATHVGEAVASLARLCQHVYLLCAHRPFQPFIERRNHLTIYRLPVPRWSPLRILFFFAVPLVFSFIFSLFGRINVVYERGRIFGGGALLGGSLFQRLRLYEMIEPYVDVPLALGKMKEDSLLHTVIAFWHRVVIWCADLVTVTHRSFLSRVPAEKALFVHTAAHPRHFTPGTPDRSLVRRYHLVRGKTVLYAGSFTPWHACASLIRAISLVVKKDPAVRLLMVGSGEGMRDCEHLVRQLGLEQHVFFPGKVLLERVPSYVRTADICVALFDRTYPAFRRLGYYYSPIKVHEYKACAKPVVASDMGTLRELVVDGKHGFLVNEQQPRMIAERLLRLIKNPRLRERMGKTNREDVLSFYTWDALHQRILAALLERRH